MNDFKETRNNLINLLKELDDQLGDIDNNVCQSFEDEGFDSFQTTNIQPKKISCSRFLAQAIDSTALPKNVHLTYG